jgi:selenium metabolism protein YedF
VNPIEIDARGLACPEPVVRAREAMLLPGAEVVRITVDSPVNAENVERMARSLGWSAAVKTRQNAILLTLQKTDAAAVAPAESGDEPAEAPAPAAVPTAAAARPPRIVVLVASHVVGAGDDQLGRVLMQAFIKTLPQLQPLPTMIVFLNAGVWLTTEEGPLADELRSLEGRGVQIVSCGTCLDFYHRKESLRVGRPTNMYEIVTSLAEADRVLRP